VDLLGFAEKRSLDRFLKSSGPLTKVSKPISVTDFCAQQTFVDQGVILDDVLRLMVD